MKRVLSPQEAFDFVRSEVSFYEFFKQAWPVLEGGVSFIDNWHIGAIAEHLEAVYKRDIRRLLINVPPRSGKSSLVSVSFPAWVWIHNPYEKFMYASYNAQLSLEHSLNCRRLIESVWYRSRWGDLCAMASDQNAKGFFENKSGGYRIATSVDGGSTGRGASILICDDPNSVSEENSDVKLEWANNWKSQIWSTRMNNPKDDCEIVIQQRFNERDISGTIIGNDLDGEWVKLILPMEFESSRRAKTVILPSNKGKIWQDPRTKEGELLCPDRFGQREVERYKRELGAYGYAGQYQQRPAPAEGGIFKKTSFRIWHEYPLPPFQHIFCSVDTALSTKEESSYSACTTWGLFNYLGHTHVMMIGLFKGRVPFDVLCERMRSLSKDYRDNGRKPVVPDGRHRIDFFLVEDKSVGIPLNSYLHKMGIRTDMFNPTPYGDKKSRAHLVRYYLGQHGLVWVPGYEKDNYDRLFESARLLLEDVLLFPNGKSNDVVDTMTQALLYLRDYNMLEHVKDRNAWGEDD
jgi:phage terminase large subunit-like protein